jgi:cation diffusion facilitator family transporter
MGQIHRKETGGRKSIILYNRGMFNTPSGAARLLLITVLGLFAMKVAVGVITGSVSIWAQAVDSSLDIFAVAITFMTVGYASKPADEEHPYGHGKIEPIAAALQSVLLLLASIAIAYSAIQRILHGAAVAYAPAGVALMIFSVAVNILLSNYLFKVAKATGSMALEANANNIRGDVFSTSGVLVGLAIVSIWKQAAIVDPILALLVVVLILRATYRVARMSFGGLVDIKLPEEEEKLIKNAITEHFGEEVVSFHKFRTRMAGNQRYIDLHLVMPKHITLEEAHEMCNHLERDMRTKLQHTDVTIHVEPCDGKCAACTIKCEKRLKAGDY